MFSLSAALALGGIAIIVAMVVLSMRKVPLALPPVKPHSETPNRARVIASLARIVPASQRVRFDPAAYPDLAAFVQAVFALCGTESVRFVATHSRDGEQQAHTVSFEKHSFKATVPSPVALESTGPLLVLINKALAASSSARRVGMLFDQQHHWFAVLEPGYSARLQRVGVVVEPAGP
ncbi:MAG: hypothetical protein Q8L48_11935 [Archangium sp.]|nr:hypothetical protein [Archangium sp.]